MNQSSDKQRFSRGRRPGVKLDEYPPKKKGANKNDRPNTERFSISYPAALARVVRRLPVEVDLELSKIFRQGVDLYVDIEHTKGKISHKTHERYWQERKGFKDEHLSGT